jgi:hypothetical protein
MAKKIPGGVVHDLPADMEEALVADSKALAAWEDITPLARNEWICWVTIVKKAETRKEHVRRTVTELKEGMRRNDIPMITFGAMVCFWMWGKHSDATKAEKNVNRDVRFRV